MRRGEEEEYQAVRDAHFKQMEKHVAGLEKPPAPVRRPGPAQLTLIKPLIPRQGGPGFLPNTELGYHIEGLTERASESDVKMNFSYQCSIIMADFHAVSEAMDAYWKTVDAQVRFDTFSDPNRYRITPVNVEAAERAELQALYNKSLDPRYLAQVRRQEFMKRPHILHAGINPITPEVAYAHPDLAMQNNMMIGGLAGNAASMHFLAALKTPLWGRYAMNISVEVANKNFGAMYDATMQGRELTQQDIASATLRGIFGGAGTTYFSGTRVLGNRDLTYATWGGLSAFDNGMYQWYSKGSLDQVNPIEAVTTGLISYTGKYTGDRIRSSIEKNSWDADINPVHLELVKSSQNKAMWFFPGMFKKDASRYLWTQWTKPE